MRILLLGLAALLGACGTPGAPSRAATASPSPPASAVRDAVEPLAGAVPFEVFLPTALRPDLPVAASLRAGTSLTDRSAIGDPVLSIEVSAVPGGKPALYLYQGPDGCCPDFGLPVTPKAVVVRSTPAEARGELFAPRSVNEGPTLRYVETSSSGSKTTIVMTGWSFGPYGTEEALLDLARSMQGLGRATPSDAVLVYYSTHISHSPTGHRISVAVRSGAPPEAARLLDAGGREISSATFEPPKAYDCLRAAAAVAPMQVREQETQEIARGSLRVEVRVSGAWVRTQLVASNCSSIE